jgi:hypothetical protein
MEARLTSRGLPLLLSRRRCQNVLHSLIVHFVDVLHQNAYTSSNLYDMETRQAADNALYVIQRATSAYSGMLSRRQRHETMIALAQDHHGDPTWYYYLVDHENSVIFWTSDFEAKDMLEEVPGATEISHIRESHLWRRRYRPSLSVSRLGAREPVLVGSPTRSCSKQLTVRKGALAPLPQQSRHLA